MYDPWVDRTYEDKCYLWHSVTEYYCQNDRVAAKTEYCQYGCENGACKQTSAYNPLDDIQNQLMSIADAVAKLLGQ